MTEIQVVRFCRQCSVGWPFGGEPTCMDPDHQLETTEVHRHRTPVTLPDGSVVIAVSFDAHDPYGRARRPDTGVYFDRCWQPPWDHTIIEWPDFGTPPDADRLADALADVVARARAGQSVELGCLGGHGRTGTALACLAVSLGVDRGAAVAWVRQHYCELAVETRAQAEFVATAPIG